MTLLQLPTGQKERQAERIAAKEENEKRKEVYKRFKVKVSPFLSRLMRESEAVRKQFLPSSNELIEFGGTATPFEEGREKEGIYGLERLYVDRVLLTPYFECSAYCRYCFKKTRTLGGDEEIENRMMTEEDLQHAIEYIRNDERIRTILITGGDPFANPPLLKKTLDMAVTIPHINRVRVGTRNILFEPHRLTDELGALLGSYNRYDPDNLANCLNIGAGISINHPDELAPEVRRAIMNLIRHGVKVRGQVVLLKGINDNAKTIKELFNLFLDMGMSVYYFLHCMPVIGGLHFRTSVQKGIDIMRETANETGESCPIYVYCTPIGKHRISPGHTLNYVTIDKKRYIKATTPYKAADFKEFTGKRELPPLHDENEEGYVISHYLDGDDNS
ncbi:radical SAM protein [Simkania negevensis]|uniref:Radical SAM protein n=1 Tax=Simkania negevensis TaxID=83561 RepID=A0ABS3AU66_9BACT|nr:radical SAM protein [Simkania negevensis]